jgi:GDPmannose 4,6-dehydratase
MTLGQEGLGVEVGIDDATGLDLAKVDRRYFRPTGGRCPAGRRDKSSTSPLGWRPEVSFTDLVAEMAKSDLKVVATDI